jgi:glycosyltransferase involved in cell wall biosynthesis
LWIFFVRERKSRFDIINFHIAYPNCTYLHLFSKWLKCPVAISEHWSGYHFNFNIKNPAKGKRIRRIFQYGVPVISVSEALLNDIRNFAKAGFPHFIIPNIVDTHIFNFSPKPAIDKGFTFFMVSQWKWPKDPFIIIYAWKRIIKEFPQINLRIGGFGPQWEDMKDLVNDLNLTGNIKLLGSLSQDKIALEMKNAIAFVHGSQYETFSVVCAEALCCGRPIIASGVGGIMEFITRKNGIPVMENTSDAFFRAITNFSQLHNSFNYEWISKDATRRFSNETIGRSYLNALVDIIKK